MRRQLNKIERKRRIEQSQSDKERMAKKEEHLRNNGVLDEISRMVSAIYLLGSVSEMLHSDLTDILQREKLPMLENSKHGVRYRKAWEEYSASFNKLIKDKSKTAGYFDDLAKFEKIAREFFKIEK